MPVGAGIGWLPADGVALTGEGKPARMATGYEYKELKPRYPAPGSPTAPAELPAAIRTYH